MTVNVTNVNEAPVVSGGRPSRVAENSANGTAVGTVTFTDPDAGQSHTFAITAGNTGGAFAIDPSTGADHGGQRGGGGLRDDADVQPDGAGDRQRLARPLGDGDGDRQPDRRERGAGRRQRRPVPGQRGRDARRAGGNRRARRRHRPGGDHADRGARRRTRARLVVHAQSPTARSATRTTAARRLRTRSPITPPTVR